MPSHVNCTVRVSPCHSRGFFDRARNIWDAGRNRAEINHVTGDVHYLAAGLQGPRTVLTVHDCVSLHRLRGLKRAAFRWAWYQWPVRRVAAVTVVSDWVRRELLKWVRCDPAKIHVIGNCVREEFKPVMNRFNQAEPVILQVGTGGTKNLSRTIVALSGVRCRLNIIGKLRSEHTALLGECGITYTNLATATEAELLTAYRECDLVVFASSYEGFGLPILEANATGRPVVTSNVCSMPEVAGGAACLVDPFDVASIRAGVNRVLSDPAYRESLVAAGFENAKRFGAARIARAYADVYTNLAGAGE